MQDLLLHFFRLLLVCKVLTANPINMDAKCMGRPVSDRKQPLKIPMRNTAYNSNRTIPHSLRRQGRQRLNHSPDSSASFSSPARSRPNERVRNEHARRHSLETLHARLRQDISQTTDVLLIESSELASNAPDAADLASDLSGQDVAVSLLDNASGTINQIESALERMDNGSYGLCEDCGSAIPAERLEVLPYATHCVGCAARREAAAGR